MGIREALGAPPNLFFSEGLTCPLRGFAAVGPKSAFMSSSLFLVKVPKVNHLFPGTSNWASGGQSDPVSDFALEAVNHIGPSFGSGSQGPRLLDHSEKGTQD